MAACQTVQGQGRMKIEQSEAKRGDRGRETQRLGETKSSDSQSGVELLLIKTDGGAVHSCGISG